MIRHITLLLMVFTISACSAHDKRFYMTHPQALQQTLNKCPGESPQDISCKQLERIATRMNELAFELRANPQEFGKRILALQETVAKQKKGLAINPNQPDLKQSLQANNSMLEERLALVRWLESPGG